MTVKERIVYYVLIAFTGVSILTGLMPSVDTEIPNLPPPTLYDVLYFVGQQITEILLLFGIYTSVKHYKISPLAFALICLSVAELFDIVMGNIIGFKVNDYVLVMGAMYIVYKKIRNGHKE